MKQIQRSYIREILDAINEKTISFAGGLPDKTLFPLDALKEATLSAMSDANALQYSKSQGLDILREQIAQRYTHYLDFPTTKEEILITTGSQQAFDIIAKSFAQKEIFVQEPSYIGALSSFKILGMYLRGFCDESTLEKDLKKDDLVYCMSDFSNPTSKCLSKEERTKLANSIVEKESFLIEDGAYTFLDFEGRIEKPISAMVHKSFHLGSFSKIIAPGLRVGWIRANKDYIKTIMACKEALDLHTPTLNQMIISNYLQQNDIEAHLKTIRIAYEQKMQHMVYCFKKYLPTFHFTQPKGGMFIYGAFEQESFSLAKSALEKNIAFVPGTVFYHDNRLCNEARFNFTNSSLEQIEYGIKQLAQLLNL